MNNLLSPTSRRSFVVPLIISFLIIFNAGIFILVNRTPVLWQQPEISYYNFFWSKAMRQDNLPILRSGLHRDDSIKLVYSEEISQEFRVRHFNFFMEMISFKLVQWIGIASFNNYALAIYHLLNSLLVFFLIRGLTASYRAGLATALLVLNNGVAFGSLLFPFINAKMLVICLFLSSWILIVKERGNFLGCASARAFFFALIFFFALLTDELTPLLFLILLVYVGLTERFSPKKIWRWAAITTMAGGAAIIVSLVFFIIDGQTGDGVVSAPYQRYLKALFDYYRQGGVFHDTAIAFFNYFLRRSLGSWDTTPSGLAATGATLFLFYLMLRSHHNRVFLKLNGTILGIIAIKAIIAPHNRGVHPFIMPEGTRFPCTLFFSFYYPYVEMILCSIILGLLLAPSLQRQKIFLWVLAGISVINLSNFWHRNEGLKETLVNHGYYSTHQHVIPSILAIQNQLKQHKSSSFYLSFPSGSKPYYSRPLVVHNIWDVDPNAYTEQLRPEFINYGNLLPILYLRPLEKGRLLMSLHNVPPPKNHHDSSAFTSAQFFYDVPRGWKIDLQALAQQYGQEALRPIVSAHSVEREITITEGREKQNLLFFIRGAASFSLEDSDGKVLAQGRQRYGYSYELFSFPLSNLSPGASKIILRAAAVAPSKEMAVVGPFLIDPAGLIKK